LHRHIIHLFHFFPCVIEVCLKSVVPVREGLQESKATNSYLEFDVFTAIVMDVAVFWVTAPCTPYEPTFQRNVSPQSEFCLATCYTLVPGSTHVRP
jgi:hypothetical protein